MAYRLLDLFCCAGGAAMGYAQAGFEVTGVDIVPRPHYPFTFLQADALDFLSAVNQDDYDAIHASPPCQRYSSATPDPARHPDLVGPVRELLEQTGLPYVIENVPGAPIRADFKLCGCMFGLGADGFELRRVRLFETSWRGYELRPPCRHSAAPSLTVLRHGSRYERNRRRGDGHHRHVPLQVGARAMGVDWPVSQDELGEAIPPAYTRHVGERLRMHLEALSPRPAGAGAGTGPAARPTSRSGPARPAR